jgi:hypothetical protein
MEAGTLEGRAVGVERWWPEHRLVACQARPGGVPAAVAEAGLMSYEDLVGAEGMAAWATHGWLGNPRPARCSDQLTLHLSGLLSRGSWIMRCFGFGALVRGE